VEAVGNDVTKFRPGGEVFGIGKRSFAEYPRAPENELAPKPANLAFERAAVVATGDERDQSSAIEESYVRDLEMRGAR
jgi:NADPH:quinone reductase-like Zn-dependent oxidoreductase